MKRLILIFPLLFSILAFGQFDPNFRQNKFNALLLNPAQAGANQFNEVTILGTQSWVGFEGAPRSMTASGNFNLKHNLGFGISGHIDQLGPTRSSRISSDLAYHLKINSDWTASIGLRGMLSSISVDLPSLTTTVKDDPYMQQALVSGTMFDVGFGGLVYSEQYYFGVSMPRLARISFMNVDMQEYVDRRGFVAYGGASFEIASSIDFRPSLVARYITSYPLLLDINAMFTYDDMFDFGINYQLMNSLGVVLGYNLGDQMSFGYCYSFPTSELNRISFQSHELMIKIRLLNEGGGGNTRSSQSPRFFN
ncbi:MAG: PorP/SprF family type IX secretion system membrane protein [Brumimicrobium sp.]